VRVEDPRAVDVMRPIDGLIGVDHGSRVLTYKDIRCMELELYIYIYIHIETQTSPPT